LRRVIVVAGGEQVRSSKGPSTVLSGLGASKHRCWRTGISERFRVAFAFHIWAAVAQMSSRTPLMMLHGVHSDSARCFVQRYVGRELTCFSFKEVFCRFYNSAGYSVF
jgi:hypothetical protein